MCVFCEIAAGRSDSHVVLEDDVTLAFLDVRPLFPGHTLLIPREHFETVSDLPPELVDPSFQNVRLLAGVIERALDAHGSFIAMNNKISQSVPHLHAHVVPRRRKDGLKRFFWPRHKYKSEKEAANIAATLRAAVEATRT
jgi:histidine triad (HIT) family protein